MASSPAAATLIRISFDTCPRPSNARLSGGRSPAASAASWAAFLAATRRESQRPAYRMCRPSQVLGECSAAAPFLGLFSVPMSEKADRAGGVVQGYSRTRNRASDGRLVDRDGGVENFCAVIVEQQVAEVVV